MTLDRSTKCALAQKKWQAKFPHATRVKWGRMGGAPRAMTPDQVTAALSSRRPPRAGTGRGNLTAPPGALDRVWARVERGMEES